MRTIADEIMEKARLEKFGERRKVKWRNEHLCDFFEANLDEQINQTKKTTWIYLLCRESRWIFIVLRTIRMELFRKVHSSV